MPKPIVMPKLGMTMREGTVLEWLVQPGEPIQTGAPLLRIESEKAEFEIEAVDSGVLRHLYATPGTTLPCGALLAALTPTAEEPFDPQAFAVTQATPEPLPAGSRTPATREVASRATRQRSRSITPAARRRAKELGVELAGIPGCGPGGRITREDVEQRARELAARVEVTPGVALELHCEGEGETVLLLPGFGTDCSVFSPQTPALLERYRVCALNPRGVGLSDAPEAERYDMETSACDAAAAIDGPVHVIGLSLGASVAIELALREPERVRSLVLMAPLVRAGGRLSAVIEAWCRIAAAADPELLAYSLLPWLYSPGYLAQVERRERALRGLAETAAKVPATTLRRSAAGLATWSGTREGDLRKLRAPTLVLAGEQDLLTPNADQIAEIIPGAKALRLPDVGHALGLEAPAEVNRAILAHLARSGEARKS